MTDLTVLNLYGIEKYREYVLADGTVYRIERPYELYTRDGSTSHRIKDSDDVVHYIPAGWKVIRWEGQVIA